MTCIFMLRLANFSYLSQFLFEFQKAFQPLWDRPPNLDDTLHQWCEATGVKEEKPPNVAQQPPVGPTVSEPLRPGSAPVVLQHH